ncbi:unnamed protein product [Pedinophyceae sp. YPF-701]|nr:unnamed protein product [Pedinophyceae sp. YPF-701]
MAPKQRKTLGPKPAVAKGSARATSVSAAKKKGKATGSALREKTNVKAGSSGALPPFDKKLEPGAIEKALRAYIKRAAKMTNGNWHDCYEETAEQCGGFFEDAVQLVNKVYAIGVKEKRCVGRCHVALLTIADLTEELESVPLRVEAKESWTGPMLGSMFPIEIVGNAGKTKFDTCLMDQIRFVWRNVLRVAAGLEGGVTDLAAGYIHEEGVAPLDQMIADALAHKCDVLNEFATGHEAECGERVESCKDVLDFMAGRRKRLQEKATGLERFGGSMDPKYRDPLPVELIPDAGLREGARKLAEAVAGAKAVPSNYETHEGQYKCRDGRFDRPRDWDAYY